MSVITTFANPLKVIVVERVENKLLQNLCYNHLHHNILLYKLTINHYIRHKVQK